MKEMVIMPIDVPELVEQVLAGSRQHIAKALTLVESSKPAHRENAREMLRQLAPHTGDAIRVGISGVPGAGKSTFINAVGGKLIEETMAAIGWTDDNGDSLSATHIRSMCAQSLHKLAELGAYGTQALAPVDRLDIYRALLRA